MAEAAAFQQSFTLLTANGDPFNVTITDLDEFVLYNVQICINYGVQIGASIVLLMVLLLLTKPDKRSSTIFVLNTLSLVLNIIRNVLLTIFFTGPFSETFAYFAQDYSQIHSGNYATSVAATVFTLLVLVCVEISLCLQVRVVCVTLRQRYRRIISGLSALIASTAAAFRIALMIENDIAILNVESSDRLAWLASASNIATTISICWFCAVFVIKLGFALNERRKLGLEKFGPMQIIFIMGCQTLIIPAIFSVLQYIVPNPAMASNVLTAVAIFLPLSSLWASVSIDRRFRTSKQRHFRDDKVGGSHLSGSTARTAFCIQNHEPVSPSNTMITAQFSESSATSPRGRGQQEICSDLEAQGHTGKEEPWEKEQLGGQTLR